MKQFIGAQRRRNGFVTNGGSFGHSIGSNIDKLGKNRDSSFSRNGGGIPQISMNTSFIPTSKNNSPA